MSNLNDGILIKWLKPVNERDYNNLVEGVDFVVLNYNKQCPRIDGLPVDFTGAEDAENLEWLIKVTGNRAGVDLRLYMENIASRPTQTSDPDYPNYHQYITEFGNVRRTNAEIIAAIRQMEKQANTSILAEGDATKLNMMQAAVTNAYRLGQVPLAPDLQEVEDRLLEVANKANQNARNAADLIALVEAGGIPDIDSGWEYDNITPKGFPFNA